MNTVNISYAIQNAKTLGDVVELVNEGTCEGIEGMEFTPEHLAGQYAQRAAQESGYPVDADSVEAHLEFLSDAGAVFDAAGAVAHAMQIEAATKPANRSDNFLRVSIDKVTGAAFDADKRASEVARILDTAAVFAENNSIPHTLHDLNGNKVGVLSRVGSNQAGSSNGIVLSFETDNDSLTNGAMGIECGRIIREAANSVRNGKLNFKLYDTNGNVVGMAEQIAQRDVEVPATHEPHQHGPDLGIDLYTDLVGAGIKVDSHASDLYVPVTPESKAILEKYPLKQANATVFNSAIDGVRTYDVPFAYSPFWEKGSARKAEDIAKAKASMSHVDPAVTATYEGKVLGVTDNHVVLSLGQSALVIRKLALDRVPAQGDYMAVKFAAGVGRVEPAKAANIER